MIPRRPIRLGVGAGALAVASAAGSGEADYEEIERLSLRAVPRIGVGYRVNESEAAWFAVDPAALRLRALLRRQHQPVPGPGVGAESDWELPMMGASWHNRLDYTTSLEDFPGDYLLRFETSLLIPTGRRSRSACRS